MWIRVAGRAGRMAAPVARGTKSVNAQLVSDSAVFTSMPVPVFDRSVGSVSIGASAVLPGGVNGFANIERLIGRDNYRSTRFTMGARIEF